MEDRVYDLRIEIVRTIKHPAVLQLLVPHIIDQTNAKEIKRLYGISTERANHRLLDQIIKSNEPGKWTAFQESLENTNYPYLSTLLKTNETSYSYQRRILELFAPFLEEVLNPHEFVAQLYQLDVIDQRDKEEIIAEQKNSGSVGATMVLLDRIQTHLEPDKWYSGFLEALYDNSYQDLVQNIDPDFYEKKQLGGGFSNGMRKQIGDKNETEFMIGNESVDETVATDNSTILENINRFWKLIIEMLDMKCVIDKLVPIVISEDKRNQLLEELDHDRAGATNQLLDYVVVTENGVAFVQCLENSDYPYLGHLLRRQCSGLHNTYCEKVIQIFSLVIQNQISTPDITSHLAAQSVINRNDVEIIQAEYHRKGNTAAAVMLLDRIQTRLSPGEWYCKFLQVLMKTSQDHIVEMVEPDFIRNPNHFAVKMNEIGQESQNDDSTSPSSDIVDEEIAQICKRRQIYMKSKRQAEDQIMKEQRYMTKFVKDKSEKLKEEVKQRAFTFETELGEYKNALLQLKERISDITQNGSIESQLANLKQQYRQFSEDIKIEVKFERNLSLHFLESVGYVTEVGSADNTKTDDSKADEQPREIVQVSANTVLLSTDTTSIKSSTDQGSSFLHITEIPSPPDDPDDTALDDKNFQDETDDITATGTGVIEHVTSKQILRLSQLKMKDITVLPGQKLAGICERQNMLIILETENFEIVSRVPLGNAKFNKLVVLKGTSIAMISPDLQPVNVVSLNESKTAQYEWECESEKCTMVSHQSGLFILCMGRHLHAYRLDESEQDMYDLGAPEDKPWRPKCAVMNRSGTELFLSDVDSVYCFKYSFKDRGQRSQWIYFGGDSSIDRQLFVGISIFDENVILLDKNNNAIMKISIQGGFFRGSIKSSSFSDCDLVAFDQEEIHLISYRYNEYKRVKLVLSPSVAEGNESFDPYVITN